MPEVVFRGGNVEDLRKAVAAVPRILSGLEPDSFGILDGFRLRLANALLSQIQQDFITKSRGGVGRDGIQWKPLDPKTIAQRRTTEEELKSFGITGKRVRGFLTPEENEEWLAVYRETFRRLVYSGMDPHEANPISFGRAWNVVKANGAKTKLMVLGSRVVDILRDTGILFRSFSPGVDDQKSTNSEGQIVRSDGPGTITVGSNQKPWHHKGIPGRLPSRPYWPLDGGIPPAWMPAIRRAAIRGLRVAVEIAAKNYAKGQ